MTSHPNRKIPIIICLTNSVSGITSWGLTLREAFKDHPTYQLLLMNLWYKQKSSDFEFNPADTAEAQAIFEAFAPAIIIPNYNWHLMHGIMNKSLAFVGMCHSDSEEEYYAPLVKHQGDFAKYIAVSPTCAKTLEKKLPHRKDDIITLPHGLQVNKKLERDYQKKPLRLVFGGRIVQKQKRVFDLVELVEQLHQKQIDFSLSIVGEGKDCAELQEKILAGPAADHIHFLGRKQPSEMDEIWANHEIYIQLSEFEGTSASMLEAMAQGAVPVVTAASSGVREVITDGKDGYIVPVGDMQAMAAAIETLSTNLSLIRKIGKAAHANAKNYSIDKYIPLFTQHLDPAVETLEKALSISTWEHINGWRKVSTYQAQLTAKNNEIESYKRKVKKLNFDASVQQANFEYQLSQKRIQLKRLEGKTAEEEQKNALIQALNQQISDQKTFIQQLENQRGSASEKLNTQLRHEKHKSHQLFEQIQQKDKHIDWLESEVAQLNSSLSIRIGRAFYPIKAFFGRLFGRKS